MAETVMCSGLVVNYVDVPHLFWKQLFQGKKMMWIGCVTGNHVEFWLSHILIKIDVYQHFPVSLLFSNVLLSHREMFFSWSKPSGLSSSTTEHSHLSLSHCHAADGEEWDTCPYWSHPLQRGTFKRSDLIWSDQKWSVIKPVPLASLWITPRACPYSLDISRESKF